MTRVDAHTKKFMEDVSGTPEAAPRDANILDPLRSARLATKIMSNPGKAISKLLVSKATKELTRDQEKTAEIDSIKIFGFLNDHYGKVWWDWEPETMWKMLRDDIFSDGTPAGIRDTLMALQVLVKTNAPFEEWHVFEKVGHAFNSSAVNFSILQPLEPQEAAYAMAVISRIRPQQEYEMEVLGYIASCAREAGMVFLPEKMFPGVQPYLDNLNFDIKFRDDIANLWGHAENRTLTDAESIQLERLREVKDYLGARGFDA